MEKRYIHRKQIPLSARQIRILARIMAEEKQRQEALKPGLVHLERLKNIGKAKFIKI